MEQHYLFILDCHAPSGARKDGQRISKTTQKTKKLSLRPGNLGEPNPRDRVGWLRVKNLLEIKWSVFIYDA